MTIFGAYLACSVTPLSVAITNVDCQFQIPSIRHAYSWWISCSRNTRRSTRGRLHSSECQLAELFEQKLLKCSSGGRNSWSYSTWRTGFDTLPSATPKSTTFVPGMQLRFLSAVLLLFCTSDTSQTHESRSSFPAKHYTKGLEVLN